MSFNPDQLDQCVGCGLCLSSCPTFDITRLEQHGPRGRIEAMRLVQDGSFELTDPGVVDSLETCVQCRACEDVCPSDVEFGALMEQARSDLADVRPSGARKDDLRGLVARGLLGLVRRPQLLRAATWLLLIAQRLRIDRALPDALQVTRRLTGVDVRPARRATVPTADVHLFRGCVMDQWFAGVHAASERVLEASGHQVDASRRSACCGALHLHAGDESEARRLASRTVDAYADTDGPIVVNSAGCGAAMREYGRLLGTPKAEAFAARVRDFGELVDLPTGSAVAPRRVVWQAPCHLRFVQGVDDATKRALESVEGLTVVEPDDGHSCCGAGGAYSLTQPEFSSQMGERKLAALDATEAEIVVSSNPGCILQLTRGGRRVEHVADVLAAALPPDASP